MLRYNDFDPQDRPFNTTIAPTVGASPNFGHALTDAAVLEPVQVLSPADLLAGGETLSSEAKAQLADKDRLLDIRADDSEKGDQFRSAPITVEENTDYLLMIGVRRGARRAAVKIKGADPRITLAWVGAPAPKKNKKAEREADTDFDDEQSLPVLQAPFATGDLNEVRLVFASDGPPVNERLAQVGEARLFKLGQTGYGWTRAPRAVIRGAQKNLFKTEIMLSLIAAGLLLLALARRARELLILLAVPVYYLSAQSFFHTEYRYILAIHHFLFVIAAVTLYVACKAAWQIAQLARARYSK
jgi:hypothetical protein